MKASLLIGLTVAFVHFSSGKVSDELRKKTVEFGIACITETGVVPEDLSSSPDSLEDRKCFDACIMEKFGMIRRDSTFDKKSFKIFYEDLLQDHPLKKENLKIIYNCVNGTKPVIGNKCETAFLFQLCKKNKLNELTDKMEKEKHKN